MSSPPAGLPATPVHDDFARLVEHYAAHHRPLPWRQTRDPYAILVSEVMLQQTRVETVLPYYDRFLARFPDWAALAAAEEPELLAAWSGLGYYRRARNLQAVAREVLARGGRLPEEEEELRALPGLGPYTAASVASIAFGRPAVALDGNAWRVLLRYFGILDDPTRPAVRRALVDRVRPAIPPARAGEFTQAVMELGATLCPPSGEPRCLLCPLAGGCRARAGGLTSRIPPPRKRKPTEQVQRAAAVLVRDGRVLLTRDQRAGLLEGLWECPGVDVPPGRKPLEALEAGLGALDLRARLSHLGEVRHAITFRDIRCQVFRGEPEGPGLPGEDRAWVERERLDGWPLPSSTRRILEQAGELPGR